MDITETQKLGTQHISTRATVEFPKKCVLQDDVGALAGNLSKANMEANLEKLTSFHTRYYKSEYGLQSSDWILQRVSEMISDAGAEGTVYAESFPHTWQQHSVIATIPGKSNTTVVIGAHQDSINLWLPSVLAAPGADDDGSGTVTIMEVFRTLLESEAVVAGEAANTIEFHWYSAEEGGLLGSQAIFQSYEESERDVKAMLQQDMTGYVQKTLDVGQPESVGVITDFVDPGLTTFIKTVIEEVSEKKNTNTTVAHSLFSAIYADYYSPTVLRYPLGRDQVRLRLLRSRLRLQGRLPFRLCHRVGL
jgi:leucyl aminopeptidase